MPAWAETTPSYGALLAEYHYPFHVRHFKLEEQGPALDMAYMRLRGVKGMPTVLLLHGKNFSGAYWRDTALFLNEKGYGVLMPDQIGFGKSSKPEDYTYSFQQLVENTVAMLDEFALSKVIVVGHSMGGMLATHLALRHPERVSRLILVNPLGLEDYARHVAMRDVSDWEADERAQTPEKLIAYQRELYYDGRWSADYEQWTLPLQGWMNGPDKTRMAKISALTYSMIFHEPIIHNFPKLSMPVRLIIGTRDRTAPGNAFQKDANTYEMGRFDLLGEAATQQLPNGKLYALDGIGHVPQVEDPLRFEKTLAKAMKD